MSERLSLNVHYVIELLDLRNMSFEELASEMNIHRNTLRSYLQNPEKISLATINSMARALKQPYGSDFIKEE